MAHRPDSLVVRSRVENRIDTQKEIFLNALKKLLNVSVAIDVTGIGRTQVYEWRKQDSAFREAWDNAISVAEGRLESAAYLKLAQELTSSKQLSMPTARLTEAMLRGFFPDKYKQTGANIEIDNRQMRITIDWSSLPDEIVSRFNSNEITLEDVYNYVISVQSQKQTGSDTSAD